MLFFFLMIRRPPTSTRTATRFPSTTLCRSAGDDAHQQRRGGRHAPRHRLGGAEYGIAREPDRVGPFEQLPPPPAFGRDPDDQRDRDAHRGDRAVLNPEHRRADQQVAHAAAADPGDEREHSPGTHKSEEERVGKKGVSTSTTRWG